MPYVRLYCSRGLVCFLKEKFNRRTLYKFYFRSWLQAPKLFEYLAKEVDRKKGISERPSPDFRVILLMDLAKGRGSMNIVRVGGGLCRFFKRIGNLTRSTRIKE